MFTLNCKGRLLVVDKALVMGIINVTPDSFYQGSRFKEKDEILSQAEKMISAGADILDIGGQSTRPGSEQISEGEELKRVIAAIGAVHQKFPGTIISIDTYRANIAKEAVNAGASIVNDISAGTMDNEMIATVATLQAPFIVMHMKGRPETMQQNPVYENVTREVLDFGKTIRHNFELLKDLSVFKMLDAPILVGLSRKSTVYKTLEISIDEALNGTTVLNTIALMNGAGILRVHDVKEAKEAVKLWSMVTNETEK
jgi:dihydropteroate synthase